MTERRQLTIAVVGCAVASAVVLFAASRTWLVEVTARPAPLPPTSVAHSGGSLVPALTALALVALAGAGAILATRGRARTVVAVFLSAVGLGITAVPAIALGDRGVTWGWVVVAAVAGLGVAAAGAMTLRYGRGWPGMGARYDRAGAATGAAAPDGRTEIDDRIAGVSRSDATSDTPASDTDMAWWDAIDRGEDPTKR